MHRVTCVENGAVTGFIQRDTSRQNTAYSSVHLENIHIEEHVTAASILLRNTSHEAATTFRDIPEQLLLHQKITEQYIKQYRH